MPLNCQQRIERLHVPALRHLMAARRQAPQRSTFSFVFIGKREEWAIPILRNPHHTITLDFTVLLMGHIEDQHQRCVLFDSTREKVANNNPCEDLPRSVRKKIPARYRRNRFLTWDEEKKLFESGLVGRREHLRPLVHLALWTGMRRGELLSLKSEHVNFGKAPLTFRVKGERIVLEPNWLLMEKTKNGKPRSIPLSRSVKQILATLCSDVTADGYVFGNPMTGSHIKDIKHGFRGACDEAGIEDLTFHDLRHTWSTRAAECGVTETVRRDILGHSSSTMTGDYTHSTHESQMAAMELVSTYKSRILDKSSTKKPINAVAAAN